MRHLLLGIIAMVIGLRLIQGGSTTYPTPYPTPRQSPTPTPSPSPTATPSHSPVVFNIHLDGRREVSPDAGPATGRGTVTLSSGNELTSKSSIRLTSPVTGMHIHGPAVVDGNQHSLRPYCDWQWRISSSIQESIHERFAT